MKKLLCGIFMAAVLSVGSGSAAFAADTDKAGATYEANIVSPGIKGAEAEDVVLAESYAGAFKKGKFIYLMVESLSFENGAYVEVIEGDMELGAVKADENILRIEVKKESSGSPSKIAVKGLKLYVPFSVSDGSYSLELVTEESSVFEDNIFGMNYSSRKDEQGKFDVPSVVLIEDFVIVKSKAE